MCSSKLKTLMTADTPPQQQPEAACLSGPCFHSLHHDLGWSFARRILSATPIDSPFAPPQLASETFIQFLEHMGPRVPTARSFIPLSHGSTRSEGGQDDLSAQRVHDVSGGRATPSWFRDDGSPEPKLYENSASEKRMFWHDFFSEMETKLELMFVLKG